MEKNVIISVIGVIGSFISQQLGGWTSGMTTLCVFMLLDYITGILVAAVFKNSDKTEDGGLESKAGYKGLIRKFAVLILVLVGCRLDIILDTNYIRDCIIITFIANECISLIENIGLMGVPLPEVITNAISILKKKGEAGSDGNSK